MKRFATLLAAALLFGVSSAVFSAPVTYVTGLGGANENPPVGSPGTGNATVVIDTAAHTLHVVVNFSGLVANTTAAHIHCCVAPPGNAGVAVTTPTLTGFPLGVTSGTYDHTFDLTQAGSWGAAFVTNNGGTVASAEAALASGLAAGNAYLNIHTSNWPGGEIRGFLAVAPVPSTPSIPTLSEWMLILLLVTLVTAGMIAMRQRRM